MGLGSMEQFAKEGSTFFEKYTFLFGFKMTDVLKQRGDGTRVLDNQFFTNGQGQLVRTIQGHCPNKARRLGPLCTLI